MRQIQMGRRTHQHSRKLNEDARHKKAQDQAAAGWQALGLAQAQGNSQPQERQRRKQ